MTVCVFVCAYTHWAFYWEYKLSNQRIILSRPLPTSHLHSRTPGLSFDSTFPSSADQLLICSLFSPLITCSIYSLVLLPLLAGLLFFSSFFPAWWTFSSFFPFFPWGFLLHAGCPNFAAFLGWFSNCYLCVFSCNFCWLISLLKPFADFRFFPFGDASGFYHLNFVTFRYFLFAAFFLYLDLFRYFSLPFMLSGGSPWLPPTRPPADQ